MVNVRGSQTVKADVREPTLRELNVDLRHITLHSTVADLPNHAFQVPPDTIGQVIAAEFEKRP
ncbi:MAG: hypothetical protein KDE51_24150, partial [Anaerolineales bacterium]|nr:hypothetical protein [Anaerolineales bacterium]